jgi:hypothetical protein
MLGKRKNYGNDGEAKEQVEKTSDVGLKKYERAIKLDYLKNDKEESLKHVSYTGTSRFPLQEFLKWFGVAPESHPKSVED